MKTISSVQSTIIASFLLAAVLASCTKEELQGSKQYEGSTGNKVLASNAYTSSIAFHIGQRYGGGVIFYIDNTRIHGLIADTTDLMKITWWNGKKYIKTGATDTAIGTGYLNTYLIKGAQGTLTNYAALACVNSTRGGKTDWFLPSKAELNELFKQRKVVQPSMPNGGFSPYSYWSSSEIDSSHAWRQTFSTGYQYSAGKNGILYVRAIRSF